MEQMELVFGERHPLPPCLFAGVCIMKPCNHIPACLGIVAIARQLRALSWNMSMFPCNAYVCDYTLRSLVLPVATSPFTRFKRFRFLQSCSSLLGFRAQAAGGIALALFYFNLRRLEWENDLALPIG